MNVTSSWQREREKEARAALTDTSAEDTQERKAARKVVAKERYEAKRPVVEARVSALAQQSVGHLVSS
jgi:hypothetical protein